MDGITRQLVVATLLCACAAPSMSQVELSDAFASDSTKPDARQNRSLDFNSAKTQTFVTYGCSHIACSEVAKVLWPLIPDATVDPSVQLVVDREQNRLLISGPPFVHNIAKRLVGELDRPTATPTFVAPASKAATQSMRAYKLPSRFHGAFVTEIRTRFGEMVRVSTDAASENVFVATTQDVQSGVAELASNYALAARTSAKQSLQAGSTGNARTAKTNATSATVATCVASPDRCFNRPFPLRARSRWTNRPRPATTVGCL